MNHDPLDLEAGTVMGELVSVMRWVEENPHKFFTACVGIIILQ